MSAHNHNNHPQRRNQAGRALWRFSRRHPVVALLSAIALVCLFPLLVAIIVHQILLPLLTPLLVILILVWGYRWVIGGRKGKNPHL